jgi:hypothetical protein
MPCTRLSPPSQPRPGLLPPRQHRHPLHPQRLRPLLHPQRLRPLLLPNNFFDASLQATALAVAFFWVRRNLRQRPAKGIQSCLE